MAVDAPAPAPMAPQRYRVIEARRETHDVVTLAVAPRDGAPIRPRAGQFDMLWAFGCGEIPISVSGIRDDGVLLHTIRSVGVVSETLTRLGAGDTVGVRGPFGTGWDVESAAGHDVVVVGGGIGFAPLRPVVEHVLADRGAYGRVSVLVGARGPADLVFAGELAGWRAPAAGVDVEVTVDAAGPSWGGHVGVVPDLVGRAAFDPERTVAFVCGPEVMMRFTTRALHDRGVPLDHIRLSAERNMQCAIAQCGHCQLGEVFVCREGPVMDAARLLALVQVRGR